LISTNLNINHSLALTKFRISAHNLAIETGRYTKPKTPVEQRLCIHCNKREIESEQHFLLVCPLYNTERVELMLKIMRFIPDLPNVSNDVKFMNIMSSKEEGVTNALAKYVYHCFDKRNHNEITII
jgi:hypothetical protein